MPAKTAVSSTRWSPTTKLIAGFTIVAIVAAFVVRFSSFLGPLLLAFILTYLLHPLARRLQERTGLPWRTAVGIVFLAFIVIVVLLLTWAGVTIVDQLANLINIVEEYLAGIPEFFTGLSTQIFNIGPFQFDFAELERVLVEEFDMDFASLGQQLLAAIQPVLGQAGSFLGALATSTITTIGWILFIFIITFLLLSDAGHRTPDVFRDANLPGHDADIRRLGRELVRIWNAFLRGQLLLVSIIMLSSFTLMSLLGVRYALALALLTGLAKFIPYVGSFAMYVTTALVTFFQPENYLGFEPGTTYMLYTTIPAILMDLSFDNLITPRFYGRALGIHPAALLVTALVAANLLGFVGLLLAAPVLASLQLFATYVFRKMVDLNPWPEEEERTPSPSEPLVRRLQRLRKRLEKFIGKLRKRFTNGK
jgi:predicted PurR-regulated permease PerM